MPGRSRSRIEHEVRKLEERFGELLEAREGQGRLAGFAEYEDDPVGFIRDVLDGRPWSAQERIATGVRDHPRVCVVGCNGSGKDWLSARLALWWAYARQGLCIVTGPTQRQVRDIVMSEVRAAFSSAGDLPGELYQTACQRRFKSVQIQRSGFRHSALDGLRVQLSSSASSLVQDGGVSPASRR